MLTVGNCKDSFRSRLPGGCGVELLDECSLSIQEWLESPRLRSIAFFAGHRLQLPTQDLPDLLQNIAVDLLKRGAATKINASYLFAVAMHRAIDLRRGNRRLQSSFTAEQHKDLNPELSHLLRARIASLDEQTRRLYELLFDYGFTERQAATQFGLSRGALRRWQERLMRRLRGQRAVDFFPTLERQHRHSLRSRRQSAT